MYRSIRKSQAHIEHGIMILFQQVCLQIVVTGSEGPAVTYKLLLAATNALTVGPAAQPGALWVTNTCVSQQVCQQGLSIVTCRSQHMVLHARGQYAILEGRPFRAGPLDPAGGALQAQTSLKPTNCTAQAIPADTVCVPERLCPYSAGHKLVIVSCHDTHFASTHLPNTCTCFEWIKHFLAYLPYT